MWKPLFTFALAMMLSVGAGKAEIPVPTTDLDRIPSGAYRLDPTHVSIVFSVSHLGFSHLTGTFDGVEGELEFAPRAPERSHLRIVVDATRSDANNGLLENMLEGPDFFDVAQHPEIIFEANQIEVTGLTTGHIEGYLSIRGLRRPIMLDVTLNGYGTNSLTLQRTLGFSATTAISRQDWGMVAYPNMLGDEITLTIEAEFLKRNFEPSDDDVFD